MCVLPNGTRYVTNNKEECESQKEVFLEMKTEKKKNFNLTFNFLCSVQLIALEISVEVGHLEEVLAYSPLQMEVCFCFYLFLKLILI